MKNRKSTTKTKLKWRRSALRAKGTGALRSDKYTRK